MSLHQLLAATGGGVYVVSFADYLPAPRYGDTPWTRVQIEEAAAAAGPWTVLVDDPLDPVDDDPSAPAARRFTLTGATLQAGWYRLTLFDAAGNQQPFDPVGNGPTYAATRDDVARLLRARTKARLAAGALGSTGNELGEFTADTRPTGEQVDDVIIDANASVAARIGATIPDAHLWLARRAVAIRAAMLVELSYFPEQTEGDDTTYARLLELYDEAMTSLETALNDNQPGQARAYSVPITSPTLSAQTAVYGVSTELLP